MRLYPIQLNLAGRKSVVGGGKVAERKVGLMFITAGLAARVIGDTAGPKVRTFITPTVTYFSVAKVAALK